MPLSAKGFRAKTHFFLDTPIEACLQPTPQAEVQSGVGTKVLITLGPACQDEDVLVQMLEAGVTCARIDLTWGTTEYHRRSLRNLAGAMRRTRRLCSVWLNTAGREMVVRRKVEYDEGGWPQHGESVQAEKGQTITISTDPSAVASASVYPINYPGFPRLVEVGQQLQVGRYLSTGAEGASLFLEVTSKTDDAVVCTALNSATLDGLLTVMICHVSDAVESVADLELPLMTQHDVECITTFGKEFEIDFISLSYCNSAQDVYQCRALLDSLGMRQTKIVAKVERKAGIHHFQEIADAADGLILSRGNLGLDFDPETMALLQKRAISRCNRMGKPVIITRVVDTMVTAPRCTRAEATDVANAVLDGVDGVMLGAETLRGLYPVETATTVARIAHSAEAFFDFRQHHEALVNEQFDEEHSTLARLNSGEFDHYELDHYGLSPTARAPHTRHGGSGYFSMSPDAAMDVPYASYSAGVAAQQAHQGNGHDMQSFGSLMRPDPDLANSMSGGVALGLGTSAPSPSPLGPGSSSSGVAANPNHNTAGQAPYTSSFGNLNLLAGMKRSESAEALRRARASMAQVLKLESVASSAVRTAEKTGSGLIVVMTQSGRTASLVAKYRPPCPILAVVVPTLRSNGLGWQLEGKYLARQCLMIRGVVPMLAAPMSEGSDDLLSEAIFLATSQRLAKPNDYVVCILSQKGVLTFKVVQVNEAGTGIKILSHRNALMTMGGVDEEEFDIVGSPTSPESAVSPSRAFSRGLSFRGAGTFGAGTFGASPMALSKEAAQAVFAEGSVHGAGKLGGEALSPTAAARHQQRQH